MTALVLLTLLAATVAHPAIYFIDGFSGSVAPYFASRLVKLSDSKAEVLGSFYSIDGYASAVWRDTFFWVDVVTLDTSAQIYEVDLTRKELKAVSRGNLPGFYGEGSLFCVL
jgi:hypothetical protein